MSQTLPSRPPPCHPDSQSSACRCRSPEPAGGTAMGGNTQFPILPNDETKMGSKINNALCTIQERKIRLPSHSRSPTGAQEALDALSAFSTDRRRWECHGCSVQSETLSQHTIRELQKKKKLIPVRWLTKTLHLLWHREAPQILQAIVAPPVKTFTQQTARWVWVSST